MPIRTGKLHYPCRKCGNTFPRYGKETLCNSCFKSSIGNRTQKSRTQSKTVKKLEGRYFECKQKMDALRDNITLERWKVLSRAYKLGKKIWGSSFTVIKLARDMDMPYTTCKRCLALDRATPETWEQIKKGKISVFKVAMICAEKNYKFQDKIVDMVVKDNLSTPKISKLHIDSIEDMNKVRHELAVENGYANKYNGFYEFERWIDRGIIFLRLDKEDLPATKIQELYDKLKVLEEQSRKFRNKLGVV
jgi:hypothetical protein